MKKVLWIQALSAIFMALSIAQASAQTDDARTYLIEVVVFENTGADSADNELFGRRFEWELDEPEPSSALQLNDPALSYVHDGTLEEIVDGLSSSSRYDLLKQMTWTQAAVDKSDAPVVSVGGGPVLTGNVQVYSNKLLFVELELRFRQLLTSVPHITVPYSSGHFQNPVYVIQEVRRLKLNEIHYFDHPRFGALVKVSRWTPRP